MKKKSRRPVTRVKNPEPNIESPDWVIWAAWADRITFEEIENKTGKTKAFFNLGTRNDWQKLLPADIKEKIEFNFKNEMKELNYI